MSEWKKVKLGEISQYVNDKIAITATNESNYISTDSMLKDRGGIIAPESIPSDGKVTKYQSNDILVSNIRPYFKKIWFSNREGGCSNDVLVFRARKGIISRYLYYILSVDTFFEHMMAGANGTKMPRGNKKLILNYSFDLPPLPTQHRIATILSRYDSLIENYQKQIKLLEEAAQRLYKEWFVDLHFPDHENTKIINGVPEGWEKRKIEELVNIKSGYAFKSKDWQSKGHPVVKIKDINGTFVLSDSLDCVPITAAKKANQFILRTGDLVIAMTGATIGKVGIVTEDNIYTNQRVGKFFVKDRFILPFLYCYFKQKSTIDLVLKISSSSAAQPNISGSQLGSFVFMYNKELLDKYCDKVQYLFQKIIMLQKQARLLTEARDRLLQKLMSGEIEMKV